MATVYLERKRLCLEGLSTPILKELLAKKRDNFKIISFAKHRTEEVEKMQELCGEDIQKIQKELSKRAGLN